MKRMFLLIIMLSAVVLTHSQTYQQTNIEFNSEIPGNSNYTFEASTSIKLLDGFRCKPMADKYVMFFINRYGVFPPEEGAVGGPATSNKDGVVGALPGELNIGDLGAAIYSIPILMPHGLGEMTPEIAIMYNNQAGNGPLGWGWDISGISSIVRMGQTLYHDNNQSVVNFVNDRFVLDGKRLMSCSGSYGGNGSIYKTEIDEMSRIISYSEGYNGPARFVINKKDGTVWEYGGTEDSRIEPQNKNDVVLKWLVNKISDLDGNTIVFNYIENHATGESYINKIDYTLNEKAGIFSMYEVQFDYDDREDAESGYVYANLVQNTKILKKIVITNMMSGAVLYDYSFSYLEPGNYSAEKFMYHRLSKIELSANGMKINATNICWNKKSNHYPAKFESFSLDKNTFNKVPFVGDFNGDGYPDVIAVPYKVGTSYFSNVQASVFLNRGNGEFDNNPFHTFTFDKTLEWIYVVDFDGNGLDDVVTYYVSDDDHTTWKSKVRVHLNRGGSFEYINEFSFYEYVIMYPGDFCAEKKISFILERMDENNSHSYTPFVIYWNGSSMAYQDLGYYATTDYPNRVVVEDINADGRSEIIYLHDNYCSVAKLTLIGNTYTFNELYTDSNFDEGDYLFPGDFNGDGYCDFLKYDNKTNWSVAFSDGNRLLAPVSCLNNNLLRGLTLVPQDRYTCSLQNISRPSVTIRTADFDGDGKTDVAVFKHTGGNYYAEIGFKMLKLSENNYGFCNIQRFYFNINHSHQYVHVGNFLGQENASILGSVRTNPYTAEIPKIVALYPQSSKYSVERITDGLGNSHGFKYEYAMPYKNNSFYDLDYQWFNDELRTVALPIKALFCDTVFSTNGNPCVTKYAYANAFYHTNGHGLLGFQRSETTFYVNNSVVERKVTEQDIETMQENFIALPKSCLKYNFSNQLVESEYYLFENYKCAQNERVVMPLMTNKKTVNYDFDTPNSILKVNIENIDYQSDMSKGSYSDVVNISSDVVGVDDTYSGYDAHSCKYWVETEYEFDNRVGEWIVARPELVRKTEHYGDNDDVGSCEIFVYSGSNPYQVTNKTLLPNAEMNYADPLKIVATYSYDAVGHAVVQSLTSPSSKNQRVTRLTFGEEYNYRYPTSSINENGWEVVNSYDRDYGILTSTLDHNQFETNCSSDPFEIVVEKTLPDGVKNVKAKRWAAGNKHAPHKASYYCWEKTSGKAETMDFFSKNGQKLREVTFGLNGEAIYTDFTYDDKGMQLSKSMPYIAGDDVKNTYYVYDENNRLIEEIYPNGLVKNYTYNKLQKTIHSISPDGITRNVTETVNPLGWRIQTVDIGGNVIKYEYYSDGKPKTAMIGDNAMTKVEYEYDNRRNISRMKDPACGEVSYEYNAYGELKTTITPKQSVTSYDYDMMGNLISREESDSKGQNIVSTQWIYDNKKGRIGMLSKIIYGDSHVVSYDYDNLLRIQSIEETINGEKYSTFYTYDNANREDVILYPSGLSIQKQYSNTGYYKSMITTDDEVVLWHTEAMDALGYITGYQVGNGLITQRIYDENSNLLSGIITKTEKSVYQNLSYSYDVFGNLVNRTKLNGGKKSESFVYDNFNRLTEIKMNNNVMGEISYDNYGNIQSKSKEGDEVFYDASYENKCPYAVSKVKTNLEDLTGKNQLVAYTVFDKISRINSGSNSLSIDYGFDYERIKSVEIVDGVTKEKVYVGDCEYVVDDGKETIFTYLKGPMGVFAVCCTDKEGNNSIKYVHKDHLDSWCLITDEEGNVVQKTSFDAWGNPRNADTWSGQYYGNMLCDRGFTGHEHMKSFGLINMNGRAYDPIMSMMLSPDNYIQNPDFSQNYNRYSYCFNNPLTYSDPSGELVEWLIYGIFHGAMNLISNMPEIDDFGEGALAFAAGMLKGCLTVGLSECSSVWQVAGAVVGNTVKAGVNNFVKQNDGSYNWANIDENAFKKEVMFAAGSSLGSSIMKTYVVKPTETSDGVKLSSKLLGGNVGAKALENKVGQIVGNIFAGNKLLEGTGLSLKDIDFKRVVIPGVSNALKDYVTRLGEIEHAEDMGGVYSMLLKIDDWIPKEIGQNSVTYSYSSLRSIFFKIFDR